MDRLSRRQFLERSALAVAAFPTLQEVKKVSPSERIRVGLIGCGGMGRGDLAAFLLNPEVECPVVCDVDDAHIEKAVKLVEEKREKSPEGLRDYRRLLDRKDIDAVIVATPDHWHALPTVHACQAGKDVYVEKPLGKCIDEGRAMWEAAKRHDRVVQMGTQWISGEHFKEAVAFIRSGKLGKIRMVRVWAYLDWVGGIGHPPDCDPPKSADYDFWLGPAPKRPFNPNRFHWHFRWFWDYAGGLMTDWGVHLINICQWAMGFEAPLRVSSSGGKYIVDDHSEVPDTQVAIYEFPGYTMVFEQQLLGHLGPHNRPHGMLFCGAEGTLIIDGDGWEVIPEPKKKSLEAFKKEAGAEARPAHVRNFLDCIQTRNQPKENLEAGHFVSKIAHLGNLAFRSRGEVVWDDKEERVIGNDEADALVGYAYRKPWKLPYSRRF
jgi:predicted dehydrogenase